MYRLTWQASTLITGVQHMAAAIVLAWVALTQMGAYLRLAVGTCRQPPHNHTYRQNTKVTVHKVRLLSL